MMTMPSILLLTTVAVSLLFAAGYLFGHTTGRSPESSLRLGALAASHVIQTLGARPQVELKALAQENGLY